MSWLIVLFRALLRSLPNRALAWTAQRFAWTRPEGVYPGWCFAVEERKPSVSVRLRLAVWREFSDRRGEPPPVKVTWYQQTVLGLRLGNDQSRCLYVSGSFEPNELAFLGGVLKPGMVFVDVGANEGFYSIYAAKLVGPKGRVVAFEPSPRERPWLQRNVRLNRLCNVEILPVGVADEEGEALLNLADDEHNGQNTLGTFGHTGVALRESVRIELTTLDRMRAKGKLPKVDVIKVDVEGAELKVLRGAATIMREDRPVLVMELFDAALNGQGSSASEVVEWLCSLDYELLAFEDATGLPSPFDSKTSPGLSIIARPMKLQGDVTGLCRN